MVRSQGENIGCKRIPVSYEGKEKNHEDCACNNSPCPGTLALTMNGTNSTTSALTALNVEVCRNTINTEQPSSSSKGELGC